MLVLGVITLGFAWLLGAVLCWVAFFRTRRRGPGPGGPVHWLAWAIGFTVLGGILVPASLVAVIGGNEHTPASPSFTNTTVPLGTPVDVRSDLGVDLKDAPARVTATAYHPAPATGGTAYVELKVCATTSSVDASLAADGLELNTSGDNDLVADTNLLQASSSFGQVVPPGSCTTGPVPFSVPSGADVVSVALPSIETGATWTIS